MERNLRPLARALDIAAAHQVSLAIETIPCKRATPLANLAQVIAQAPRSRIALDTEFLADHSQLFDIFAQDWAWEEQRVQHVHIKDFDGLAFLPNGRRRYLHPKEGKIDFALFFARLQERNFQGTISLELPALNEEGVVDIAKI